MRRVLLPVLLCSAFAWLTCSDSSSDLLAEPEAAAVPAPIDRSLIDRSPVDVVLLAGGKLLATANQTSDSISLVRVADGKVLDELKVGAKPAALETNSSGDLLLVSSAESGEVASFQLRGEQLLRGAVIQVGFEPHGMAIDSRMRRAYVATAASGEVAVLDLARHSVADRIAVGAWPRYLALSEDGHRLAVGVSGERGVAVVDTESRQTLFVERFVGLNIGHLKVTKDGSHVYFPWIVYRRTSPTQSNIRRGWVLASRIARVRLDEHQRRDAISLDPQGRAIADPHGLDFTSDEQRLVVSASGTKELLVYRMSDLPWIDFGDTDHVDRGLLSNPDRFQRIDLGGRPMGLQIAPDDKTVFVANYIKNSVQVVDLESRKVVREIGLGGPAAPSPARRGEAIFYDATYSLDQWYSCHSCHYEGGPNAVQIDTFNDDSEATYKTVLPLYHLSETGPWTWHGWQQDLDAAMRKSITSTMQGKPPSDEDVQAMLAYFRQLKAPPNPFRQATGGVLSADALRGKAVFEGKVAGCANCHNGPHYTDGKIHDVGLGASRDRYQGYNTPSLTGVHRKVRLLHDGRSKSLEELLTGPHNPAEVTGEGELSDQQRRELIEYLKSL